MSSHVAAAVLAAGLALVAVSCRGEPRSAARVAPPADAAVLDGATPSDAERDRAFAYFLDSPRPFAVLDQGLAIAEKVRQRYGIDTGNHEADRRAAALRFQAEVLDRIVFSGEEIEATALGLGYSLDPEKCLNACENIRRLAEIDLKKAALQAFADGRVLPGRMP